MRWHDYDPTTGRGLIWKHDWYGKVESSRHQTDEEWKRECVKAIAEGESDIKDMLAKLEDMREKLKGMRARHAERWDDERD